MKRLFILFLLTSITSLAFAQCTFNNFYKYYFYISWTTKTIATTDGGFITVTGAAYDTLNPGTQNGQDEDMCVVKTDSCGNTQWTTHYGSPSEGDDAIDVVETSNGDFLVIGYAGFQQAAGNIRVAKFSKINGHLVWSKLYSGTKESIPFSITKRKNKNTYIVNGLIRYPGIIDKGYSIEIDDSGTILKNVEITGFNSSVYRNVDIVKLFEKNDTSYLQLVLTKDTIFLVETDTSFNVRWINKISLGKIYTYFNACLSHDGKSIALVLDAIPPTSTFTFSMVANIDLLGNLLNYKIIPKDSFSWTFAITPTIENGFIITNNDIMKLDSSLNLIWQKPLSFGLLKSVCVTNTGYIIGSGRSITFDSAGYHLYVIKMDSNGNYVQTGINEASTSLNTKINLFPNPSSGKIHIQTKNNETINSVKLFDFTGKEISISIPETHSTEITIDATNLKPGIYFMMINGVAHKIVKE
ncbi:MAG: T9SS type A sorting domain-containing protein [Bacteroidota bacterium]